MKVVPLALPKPLLARCHEEFKQTEIWKSSTLAWEPMIKQGIFGSTLVAGCSVKTTQDIFESVRPHIPLVDEFSASYYLWQPMSGISIHNDDKYAFSATIYLNNNWKPNYGGWFIWKDKTAGEWKTILPKENLMVVNLDNEDHLVTIIPPEHGLLRKTIQIRGKF